MSRKPVVLWFRNDLRLSDHAALVAASRSGAPVIPLYILDDNLPGRWAPGGASRWWLAKSIAALTDDLAKRGAKLSLAAETPQLSCRASLLRLEQQASISRAATNPGPSHSKTA
jgi:deoxyribodipyrimidine photo-lyase